MTACVELLRDAVAADVADVVIAVVAVSKLKLLVSDLESNILLYGTSDYNSGLKQN